MGKSSAPPPDYTPLANASKEAAEVMAGLGREQLDFAREQYNQSAPILQGIANQQIAAQAEQMSQARDYYNYQRDTYRPIEQSIAQDAMRFNTEAYRNDLASKAAADAGTAFNQNQQMSQRAMASMGVNPNSGRFAGINAASNLGLAANRAATMTNTRTQAEQLGYARQIDAAGLGRNLAGNSIAAYGGATGAGNAAGLNAQSAGQNYMGNMAIGAGTMQGGYNAQIQGLSNILNNQTSAYINTNDSLMGDLGALAGGAASAYTAWQTSDRRLKQDILEVGVDQRTALPLYEFAYKADPSKKYIGVMADEVELSYPEAVIVTESGFKAVNYGMLGIEFKEVA